MGPSHQRRSERSSCKCSLGDRYGHVGVWALQTCVQLCRVVLQFPGKVWPSLQ